MHYSVGFLHATDCCLFQRTIVPTSAMTGCDCSGRRVKLGQLLEAFLSVEQLNGDNQYRCDRCLMLRSGERVVSIVRAPPYMVFTILRFWYDQTRLTGHKVSNGMTKKKIVWPCAIDLALVCSFSIIGCIQCFMPHICR